MPVAYGNNGKFDGGFWVMDTERDAPSGDPSEKCGNNSFYKIPTSKITERITFGYCFGLPGVPQGWKVTYAASLKTAFKDGDVIDPEGAYKVEKTEGFSWGKSEEEIANLASKG